jgi:hypothetical protein
LERFAQNAKCRQVLKPLQKLKSYNVRTNRFSFVTLVTV